MRFKSFGHILLIVFFFFAIFVVATNSSDAQRPNIILINLDDADYDMLNLDFTQSNRTFFPPIKKLAQSGVRFTNFHVTSPLCGPSRACLLRGQYAHNVGIRINGPQDERSFGFTGGYLFYKRQGHTKNDLSTWMQRAGYRTLMVGKYLHPNLANDVPPGWDQFISYDNSVYYGVHRYVNGKPRNLRKSIYRTVHETSDVIRLMKAHAPIRNRNGQPFFMYYAPFAPHSASQHTAFSMVESKYSKIWKNLNAPRSPNFLEADLSDKPPEYLQFLNPNVESFVPLLNEAYRNRLRATKTVDDSIGRIVTALKQMGEFQDTYIFLTSDNGYFLGEHRLVGKQHPYDSATHVPMFVSGPGIPRGRKYNQLLGHIDIAPTIVELAGGKVPGFVDGRSFSSLLKKGRNSTKIIRDHLLIQNWQSKFRRSITQVNPVSFELAYIGLRLHDESYIERATGNFEYYDFAKDPFQLRNGFANLPAGQKEMFSEITRMEFGGPKAPKVTIAIPFNGAIAPKDFDVRGTVESDFGTKSVKISVQNMFTKRFWDGMKWQSKAVQFPAQLASPNNTISYWHFRFRNFTANDGAKINIRVSSTDTKGNSRSEVASKMITVDSQKPTTKFTSHRNGDRIGIVTRVQGTAQDNQHVERVQVYIKRNSSDSWWNGKSWQSKKIPHPSIVEKGKNGDRFLWRTNIRIPTKGKIVVYARAIDSSGNESESFAKIKLTRK